MSKLQRSSNLNLTLLCGLLAVLVSTGCSTTRQGRSVEQSGFLGDYSQLREGERGEALWVYIDQEADWAGFDSFHIQEISIWKSEDLDALTQEEQDSLCNALRNAIHLEITKVVPHVESPGERTVILRAAITEADAAKVALNAVTTIVPQTRALATLGNLATDKAVLVGQASIEVEVLDPSGRRLAAGVDRRLGNKTIRNAFSEWGDVNDSFLEWGERFRERFLELRASSRSRSGR